MVRIIIADDHPAIRKGVRLILQSEYPGAEFGEAGNAGEILKLLREKKWDVLIMDMDMPGRNGLDVLKQLKDDKATVRTLIFSMHPEGPIAVRALKAGAHGYLAKDAADGELARAMQMLLAGKKYITPEVASYLAEQLENPGDRPPHELLSDREYQTLLLFAAGKTVSQIAEELSLSVPTISTYRARILEKMGMKNNAELMNYAVRNKLV